MFDSSGKLGACLTIATVLTLAGAGIPEAGELSGFVATEVRMFPSSPAFPDQDDDPFQASFVLQPEYRIDWNDRRDRFTIVPFLRLDATDGERTHADLREFNWLHIGPDWDLRVGLGKVFWGVTESRHLVDIVNQTDLVENIDEEDKLGQPMVNLSLIRDWGTLSLFALPGFRERTFPGRDGRLRSEPRVDTDRAEYDSSLEEWHVDFAGRWSHAIGDVDVGLAHFWGTGREPRLLPRLDSFGRPISLIPRYDIIHQTSLDLQATLGAWLWKLEAITRSGQGGRFGALVSGFEYTFYQLFDTDIDLGILAEYLYDGRDDDAPPTLFDDDLFFGVRLGFNDPQSTELLVDIIVDRDTQANIFSIEGSRRLGDRWTLELEVRVFSDIPSTDPLFSLRKDDLIQIQLSRFF